MALNTVLDTTTYAKLRGQRWAGHQFAIFTPNTVVFKCRVNGAVSGGPAAQFAWDTATIGAYTDIEVGQRLLISHVDDIREAYFDGRVRAAPDGTNFYPNETGWNFRDNDYVFVVDAYPLTHRLARPLSTTTQAKDFDKAFHTLAPVIVGLHDFVGEVDPVTGKLRIAIDVSDSYSPEATASGVLTFQFTFKSGTATVIAGGLTNPVSTFDITEGHQWAKLVVEDDLGVTWEQRFEIHATGDIYSAFDLGTDPAEIEGSIEEGWTCRLNAWSGISEVLPRTKAIIFKYKEWYSGVQGSLWGTNNIDFVGYLSEEDDLDDEDPDYARVNSTQFELVSPSAKLANLKAQMLAIRLGSPAAQWDEINSLNSKRAWLYYLQEHSTYLNLYGVRFDDETELFPLIPQDADNILDAGKRIMGLKSAIVFDPDGSMEVITTVAGYLDQDGRDALPVIADWTDYDRCGPIKVSFRHDEAVGYVDADGAFYDTTTGRTIAVTSIAPSTATTEGTASFALSGVILPPDIGEAAAQVLIDQDSGNALSIGQTTWVLTTNQQDGYHCLRPSPNELFTWTYTDESRGIAFDDTTFWYLDKIRHVHTENGGREVETTYKMLSPIGDPGDKPPDETAGEIEITLPDLPPFPPFPEFTDPSLLFPDSGLDLADIRPDLLVPPKGYIVKPDGNTHLAGDDTTLLLVEELIALTNPKTRVITPLLPAGYTLRDAKFDPANRGLSGGNNRAYALASDGTNSKVFSTMNCFAPAPAYTESNTFSGEYQTLRAAGAVGKYMVYTPGNTTSSLFASLTVLATTATPVTTPATTLGKIYQIDFSGTWQAGVFGGPIFGDAFWRQNGSGGPYTINDVQVYIDNAPYLPTPTFAASHNYTIYVAGTGSALALKCFDINYADNAGSISAIVYELAAPAAVRVSTDYCLTFGSPVVVGPTPGTVGGIDTQKAGTVPYAGTHNAVMKATTVGGAFSTAPGGALTADPVSILQPYYTWGSFTSRNTALANPDYAVLTNAAGSSLKRITGAGTVTDISPVAGFQGYMANALTSLYGKLMAAGGKVSGNQKVYATKNADSATPTWVLVHSPTNCNYIRCRRNDTTALKSGNPGQLFIADVNGIYFTSTWTGTAHLHTLPITPLYFDPLN